MEEFMEEISLIDEIEGRIYDPRTESEVMVANVIHLLPVVSKAYIALLTKQRAAYVYVARAIVEILHDNEGSQVSKQVSKWAMSIAQEIVTSKNGTLRFLEIIEDLGINPEILYVYLSSPVYAGEKEDHTVILGIKKPFSTKSVFTWWLKDFQESLEHELFNPMELIEGFMRKIKSKYYNTYLWNRVGVEFNIFSKMVHDRTFKILNSIFKREGKSPLFWFSPTKKLWFIRREHYREVAELYPQLLKFHKDYLEKFKK